MCLSLFSCGLMYIFCSHILNVCDINVDVFILDGQFYILFYTRFYALRRYNPTTGEEVVGNVQEEAGHLEQGES